MINEENLKKQIIYRSTHRGSKEMDILLGSFAKSKIKKLKEDDLLDLLNVMSLSDETLHEFYFNNKNIKNNFENKILKMLKNFKI